MKRTYKYKDNVYSNCLYRHANNHVKYVNILLYVHVYKLSEQKYITLNSKQMNRAYKKAIKHNIKPFYQHSCNYGDKVNLIKCYYYEDFQKYK